MTAFFGEDEKTPTRKQSSAFKENSATVADSSLFTPRKKEKWQESLELTSDDIYTNGQPELWFHLQSDDQGQIKIPIHTSYGKYRKLIYVFMNNETKKLLIGKTESTFSSRMSIYQTKMNSNEAFPDGSFISDVRKNPSQFSVGLLYLLQEEEDIDLTESLFIEHKGAVHELYNVNRGGGGGVARKKTEGVSIGFVNPEISPLTPDKYYPVIVREDGSIRPEFSPGFENTVQKMKEKMKGQNIGFLYAFKNLDTNQHYYGGTQQSHPVQRIKQHCYNAEYFNPDHPKYDPTKKDGNFHPELGSQPQKFGVNLIPVTYSPVQTISPARKSTYLFSESLGSAETELIKLNKSLIDEQGFNTYNGGGGPASKN